ncbi:ANKRD50 [Branchiostoma lanceolatum]|uniref:ANKRD50 protein n=1 Tax=Branchiostoma lanceolatum TaxID=7740 RepID=A0A8K0EB95_BRALA|nr:ANKRD50 [Branchiostoma lanceolatum]
MATEFEVGIQGSDPIATTKDCDSANGEVKNPDRERQNTITETTPASTVNAMLDEQQNRRVIIHVKNVSAMQVGDNNIINSTSTAESQDSAAVGATTSPPQSVNPGVAASSATASLAVGATASPPQSLVNPSEVLVYQIENCEILQFGNHNSIIKKVTPQEDEIVKICSKLDIDPKKADDIFERLSDINVRKQFAKKLAERCNLNCNIKTATKGCILLELEVPTEADRLQLIRMARDGTFQQVFLETFLPEFAAEGRAVSMNLAIGVRNPSKAMVEELQGAVASSNNENVVVVEIPAATNDPLAATKQDPESTEGESSELSEDLAEACQSQLNLENGSKGAKKDDETPLWTAAQVGNLPTIQMLIDKGTDVNMEDEDGQTSVWAASKSGHAATVEMLIAKGADVNKADKKGRTPLWVAAQNDHVSVEEKLITKGADVNIADKEGRAPLWVAAQNGHIPTIETLISKGANVNMADKEGRTPLWVAAQKDSNLLTVETLINQGANVNMADGDGRTSLWVAAQNGCFSTAKLLIRRGANVNKADDHSQTPLWVASQGGHLQIVELLFRKGADVNTMDEDAQTSLWIAAQEGHLPVVEMLLRNGVDVNMADKDGQPPLWIASQEGHHSVVDRLLSKGAEVNVADIDHQTPLSVAAQWDHISVVEMLLGKGADVNMADKDGRTPLWIAALKGHLPTIKMLLSKGADVNKADKYGKTPLWIALQFEQYHTVEVLLSNGAVEVADNDGGTQSTILLLSIRNRYMRRKGDDDNRASKRGAGPTDVAESMSQSLPVGVN